MLWYDMIIIIYFLWDHSYTINSNQQWDQEFFGCVFECVYGCLIKALIMIFLWWPLQNESERLQGQLAHLRSQQSREAEKHQLLVTSLNEQLKG